MGHLRRVVVYNGDGYCDERLADLLDDAMDQGIINQQEWEEAWSIHTVLRGEDRQDGSVAYATVDIAMTVEDHHINNVSSRAGILRRITGERTIPAIIGAFLSDDSLRQLAQERRVSLVHASLEDSKLYRYFGEDAPEAIGLGKPEL